MSREGQNIPGPSPDGVVEIASQQTVARRIRNLAVRNEPKAGLVGLKLENTRLSQLGHPTPNVFAGGLMFHSRREWIAESSLMKSAETVIHLARYWSERKV